MASLTLKAILLLVLPVAVFVGGGWTMGKLVGREYVTQLLEMANKEDRKPLGSLATIWQRLTGTGARSIPMHA